MKKIEIELDETIYQKIEKLTTIHHCQVSELIKAMIEQLTQEEKLNNSLIGQWSNDAEIVTN
jgi:metal-responsive CopG/Arc/MetJ family transcriptional regulator